MSFAVARGFAFSRVYRIVAPLAQAKVTALPQEVVYSLETMFAVLLAATDSRFPDPDSHARSALSRSTGPTFVVALATTVPHALPSQLQALTCVLVRSPPITPIYLLPLLDATLTTEYPYCVHPLPG